METVKQLELDLYHAGYRESTNARPRKSLLSMRQAHLTKEQMYWAVVGAIELVAEMSDPRKVRQLNRLLRRDAMRLVRHLPEPEQLEGILQRGMDFKPTMGQQAGTIPAPPRLYFG